MDSSETSDESSPMLSSDDDLSSNLEIGADRFQPPPVFAELLELTTYDDGIQVKLIAPTKFVGLYSTFHHNLQLVDIFAIFAGVERNCKMDQISRSSRS